jgi:hypothetical protein
MFQVFPLESVRVGKYCDGLLERNSVLLEIPGGFSSIPGEHNLCIYDKYSRTSSYLDAACDREEPVSRVLYLTLTVFLRKVFARFQSISARFCGRDAERGIEEFKRLSGGGNSGGWRFRRDEIHQR